MPIKQIFEVVTVVYGIPSVREVWASSPAEAQARALDSVLPAFQDDLKHTPLATVAAVRLKSPM